MPKFTIRAHYRFNTVRLGTVEAADRNAALLQAEDMGLLDDPHADDFTARPVPEGGNDLSKILGDAIKAASADKPRE